MIHHTQMSRVFSFIGKRGVLPVATSIAVLSAHDNHNDILKYPVSSMVQSIIAGGIGGCIIEGLAPVYYHPIIVGSLIIISIINVYNSNKNKE